VTDPTTSEQIPVQIDFKALRRPADVGVTRASVFLGLTTNAVAEGRQLSHLLDDRVQYRFVPDTVTPATAEHFREEFLYWVVGNALRELADAFSAFLINCRPVIRMMQTKRINWSELGQLAEAIEAKNISQQYEEIQELIGLDPIYAEMFETFRRARNCLAHRRGVVAARDANADGQFKLRWCFMGAFLQTNGTEHAIDADTIADGIVTGPEGGMIVLRLTWKEKSFPIGGQIRLTRHDLAEICFGVHSATAHVIGKMHEFAKGHGIPDAETQGSAVETEQVPSDIAMPERLDRD
jgi:hypothetical protein